MNKQEEQAYQKLLADYENVVGKKPDSMAEMICKISAKRALTQKYEWANANNPNFPTELNWL